MSDVWERMEKRRTEGQRRAENNKPTLKQTISEADRFKRTWELKKMNKALEIHPYLNSTDDWQRYYEAKYVINLRRGRSRKR